MVTGKRWPAQKKRGLDVAFENKMICDEPDQDSKCVKYVLHYLVVLNY